MVAICKRVMQFTAGPNEHEFHACAEHRPQLEAGDVDLFFATANEPVREVDPEDEMSCWFCQEGGD